VSTELAKRESTLPVHVPRPCFYRYQEVHYSERSLMLVLHEYIILSRTPRGTWIDVFCRKRFVLDGARKRYACPTKEEALESYRARKEKQIGILEHQLARARAALNLKADGEREYFGDHL
jgi:hypothetical protein